MSDLFNKYLIRFLCIVVLFMFTGCTKNNDEIPAGSGLDQRPSNTTCIAPDRPTGNADIQLDAVFSNLSFTLPLALLQAPGDNARWFVVEKGGYVRVFANNPAVTTSSIFIDITDRVDASASESGLLGIAFHPDFQNNGYVFVSYTSTGLVSHISRFESLDGGLTLDPASEQSILTLDQPYTNHNGGHIAFGPDEYLYIGFGDGGSGGDPQGNGQNTNTLLGALLRIDVNVSQPDWDSGTRYYIPSTNHFASNADCLSADGCPEIFAWGLRNPWRWSFDKNTGDLWLGDVGQGQWEEIDIIEGGGNYGWNIREGAHCYNATTCDTTGLFDPVAEYDHSQGNCSVTGGYVYRGTSIPALQGVYVFGDFCSGRIWGFDNNQAIPVAEEKLVSGRSISSFAEGSDGELYVLDYVNGGIYQIAEATSSGSNTVATLLSDTGCFSKADPTQPAPGLIPYDVNSKLWSDGLVKERFMAIPDNTTIEIDATEDWIFPIGTILVKQFRHAGKLIETRLLMRHTDGEWGGYTYEWDDLENDATLVVGGKTKLIDGLTWTYPSSAQCMYCHTAVAGRVLGPETAQMNMDFHYTATDRTSNQLLTYSSIGLFSAPLSNPPTNLPALVDPTDTSADLEQRVRSYLHSNCSHCHRSGGPTPANIQLHYAKPAADMNVCDVMPTGIDLGITDARIVAPGDPSRSILLNRMQRRDIYGMPPLGTNIVDTNGVTLMENWITSLGATCP